MAGHPTIGSTFALAADGTIPRGREKFVFELGVGPIDVSLEWGNDGLSFASTLTALVQLRGGAPVVDVRALDADLTYQAVPAPLAMLFRPAVQGFLIDLARTDPAKLAAATRLPMLIVRGDADIPAAAAAAAALAAARPDAMRVAIPRMNHVFKDVDPSDRAANLASYSDETAPIDPAQAKAIAGFVQKKR